MSEGQGQTMRATGEIVTLMIEAYGSRFGRYVRIAEIAQAAGLTPAEVNAGVVELLDTCDDFRAEPEPFGHRVSADDRAYGPVVGGEARHLILFA